MAVTETKPFEGRLVESDDVLFRELDGEAVLLNLDNELYYGLDAIGTQMWVVLTTSDSIQSAYQKLLLEYDVEPERLQADLHELIEDLTKEGLVSVSA